MTRFPSHPLVGPFADALFAADLPSLPADRRREVVSFVARRADGLPSFIRFGVLVIAALYRGAMAVPGAWPVVRFIAGKPLPVISEYPRLIRSLGYTYIWERWPATAPDGGVR